jgi:hypothetical protein
MGGLGEGSKRRTFSSGARACATGMAAAAAVLFLGACSNQPSADSPEGVEAQLLRSPSDHDAALALKANYPQVYQDLLRRTAAAIRARGGQTASREVSAFMARFVASKANAVASAPDRDLQRIGGAQASLIRALRDENVALCADYAVRGLRPGSRLSPATQALLGRLAVYVIEAARAGERPGRTQRPPLSQADGQALFAAMRARDPATAEAVERGTAVSLPPEGQCRAGLLLYETVTGLPAATSANVTAQLVLESVRTPPAAN